MEALAMNAQASGKATGIPAIRRKRVRRRDELRLHVQLVIVTVDLITIFFIPHIPSRGRGPDQASQN